jgi:hypothetical protein
MSAPLSAPSVTRDAEAVTIPVFGSSIAEDPCQILGDPWSGRDRAAGAPRDDRPGIHPFARLTRRKH